MKVNYEKVLQTGAIYIFSFISTRHMLTFLLAGNQFIFCKQVLVAICLVWNVVHLQVKGKPGSFEFFCLRGNSIFLGEGGVVTLIETMILYQLCYYTLH